MTWIHTSQKLSKGAISTGKGAQHQSSGNARWNHKEITLHTCWMVRMWSNWCVSIGIVTLGKSLPVPHKGKHMPTPWLSDYFHRYNQERQVYGPTARFVQEYSHSSKLGTTQVPINKLVDNQTNGTFIHWDISLPF